MGRRVVGRSSTQSRSPRSAMLTDMPVHLSTGQMLVDPENLDRKIRHLNATQDPAQTLHSLRPMIDPWNILGFGGQFPQLPGSSRTRSTITASMISPTSSTPSSPSTLRAFKRKAARGKSAVDADLTEGRAARPGEQDRFATTTVGEVPLLPGARSGDLPSSTSPQALAQWHEQRAGGPQATSRSGTRIAEKFRSPPAFRHGRRGLARTLRHTSALMALLVT